MSEWTKFIDSIPDRDVREYLRHLMQLDLGDVGLHHLPALDEQQKIAQALNAVRASGVALCSLSESGHLLQGI